MMDHREYLTSLPADLREAMTERTDGPGLKHLAGHGAAIVVLGALIGFAIPGWWFLLPVQGLVIIFLFTLEHEATHRTPFRSAGLNTWAGRVSGFLILLPFEWFRYFHLAHHRWTNIDGKDPELEGGKPATLAAWIWHVSGLPYWGSELRLMGSLILGRAEGAYLPVAAKGRIVAEARGMAVGYLIAGLTLFWTPLLFWVWLLPVIMGQPFLRLYLLAEHGDCPRVANMFLNTRTTFTNRLVRWLAWNMPYHVEHHVWPAVPFHQLPAAHRLMQDRLEVTAKSYAAFSRDYLKRRL